MPKEKSKIEQPKAIEGDLQARLIKLREEAGFDMPQMAAGLCLSQDVIINLENENFDLLPEPPYVRGYLRTYAKLGENNDPSDLINCYESLRGADADELNFQSKIDTLGKSKKSISPALGQIIALAVLIGILFLIYLIPPVNQWVSKTWQGFSQTNSSGAEDNPSLLGQLPIPSPLPSEENSLPSSETNSLPTVDAQNQSTSGNIQTAEEQNTSNDASNNADNINNSVKPTDDLKGTSSTENADNETGTKSDTAQSNETQAPEDTALPSPDGSIKLKLVFNEEVWMRIKDKDGTSVFEGLNKAGTEQSIDLQKPLTFRVGNAKGLSLFIDNQVTDISSYINGSIANFTLE